MQTELLYYQDSHMRTFQAVVAACEPYKKHWRAALDRTCFFPEGGGQAGDRGILRASDTDTLVQVLDTQIQDQTVWHTLSAPLPEGAQVKGELNWELRFARMQCHSGEHIVSGLIHQRHELDNVGFHLGDEEVTLDFNGPLTWEQVQVVERLANQAVAHNLPVSAAVLPPAALKTLDYRSKLALTENVRIVSIPGYDTCACCAPHVAHTGEIGVIHILSLQNYKGGVRLKMLCGSRAVDDLMVKHNNLSEIAVLLSAKPNRAAEAVRRQAGDLERARQTITALGRKLAENSADALPSGGCPVCFTQFDPETMRTFVNAVLARGADLCAAFTPADGNCWQYIVGVPEGSDRDLRALAKEMNAGLNGRGGGTAQMIQGRVQADQDAISAWWTARQGTVYSL